MSTCGYICPVCEGKQFDENGKLCSWCANENDGEAKQKQKEENLKTWISKVHEGPCCGDL